jgi:hypothetical protein
MTITPHAGRSSPQTVPVARAADDDLAPLEAERGAGRQPAPLDGKRQGLGARRALTSLSEDQQRHIAGFVAGRDLLALAMVNRGMGRALPRMLPGARMVASAQQVRTLCAFEQILGGVGTQLGDGSNTIRSLAPAQRALPLAALALQIRYLAPQEARAAIADLQAAFNALAEEHRTPALTRLARSATASVAVAIASPERHYQSPGHRAASHGADIQTTALFYGTTTAIQIHSLEVAAALSSEPASAGAAARGGENVQNVAREFGITSNVGIFLLERQAIVTANPALTRATASLDWNVPNIARQFGITTPRGIVLLELRTITGAPANRHGADPSRENPIHANPIRDRLQTGENVQRVAEMYGITTEEGILELDQLALNSEHEDSARSLLLSEMTVGFVAQHYGTGLAGTRQLLSRLRGERAQEQERERERLNPPDRCAVS